MSLYCTVKLKPRPAQLKSGSDFCQDYRGVTSIQDLDITDMGADVHGA